MWIHIQINCWLIIIRRGFEVKRFTQINYYIGKSRAGVLFSNCSPGNNIVFVRKGNYRDFFKNDNYRRQIHEHPFLISNGLRDWP